MPYHLHLTLEQRATLSTAISIWDSYEIKNKITKWSKNYQQSGWSIVKREWKQLIEEVVEKVKQIPLPPRLQAELFHVVKALGVKIFNWYLHILNEHRAICGKEGVITNYIREIYWTPLGTIDEVKILQSYWMKNPNLNVAVLYNIACKNAVEKDINDLWQKIPNTIKDRYVEFSRNTHDNSFYTYSRWDRIMFAYWKYRRDGHIDHFINFVRSNYLFTDENGRVMYYQNYSVEHNMFLFSVHRGYSPAVKYFWNKLTQKERGSSVLYSAYVAVVYYNKGSLWSIVLTHVKEKYVEILMFLMNQMTSSQKKSFLRDESASVRMINLTTGHKDVKSGILPMFLCIWPWQELFLPVLSDMLQYPEHNKHSAAVAVFKISEYMCKLDDVAEKSKYRSIFHEVWLIIPGSIKRRMILDDANLIFFESFIVNLFKAEDLDSIKMIFNDPEIEDVRMQYIQLGQNGYERLIICNEYEFLDQFMEEVLRSEEEQKYLKSLINHINMCEFHIEFKGYNSADKLLNWKFEAAEERKQCKNHFKDHDVFIHWVLNTLDVCDYCVRTAKRKLLDFWNGCLSRKTKFHVSRKKL